MAAGSGVPGKKSLGLQFSLDTRIFTADSGRRPSIPSILFGTHIYFLVQERRSLGFHCNHGLRGNVLRNLKLSISTPNLNFSLTFLLRDSIEIPRDHIATRTDDLSKMRMMQAVRFLEAKDKRAVRPEHTISSCAAKGRHT